MEQAGKLKWVLLGGTDTFKAQHRGRSIWNYESRAFEACGFFSWSSWNVSLGSRVYGAVFGRHTSMRHAISHGKRAADLLFLHTKGSTVQGLTCGCGCGCGSNVVF